MSAPETQKSLAYRQEDIQQILQLAIACQAYEGEFSHEQLVEIAAELEISPECLQAAERDWLKQNLVQQKRQAFDQYRWGKLKQKIGKYLIVNTFLVAINLVSAATLSWSLYVLLGWGLWLALQAWKTFPPRGEAYEQAFQRWERKHQLKRSMQILWNKLQQAL